MAKTIGIMELLEKVEDNGVVRHKVHPSADRNKWIRYPYEECSWMACQEDIISYCEYINSHKEN